MSELNHIKEITINGNTADYVMRKYTSNISDKDKALITVETLDDIIDKQFIPCALDWNKQHELNMIYDTNNVTSEDEVTTRDTTTTSKNSTYGLTVNIDKLNNTFYYPVDSLENATSAKVYLSSNISENKINYTCVSSTLNNISDKVNEIIISDKIKVNLSFNNVIDVYYNTDLTNESVNIPKSSIHISKPYNKLGLSQNTKVKINCEKIYLNKNFFNDEDIDNLPSGYFGDWSEFNGLIYVDTTGLKTSLIGDAIVSKLIGLLKNPCVINDDIEIVYYASDGKISFSTTKKVIVLPDPADPPTSGTLSCDSSVVKTQIIGLKISGVTSVYSNAFWGCYSLKCVKIDHGLDAISSGAFNFCSELVYINIPVTVDTIGNGAFTGCSSLTNITIPNSITTINYQAFSQCGLINIDIPKSVTEIQQNAFSECKSLKCINIPYGVTRIDSYAFNYCSKLEHATIPDSVTYYGQNVFNNCVNLKTVVCMITSNTCSFPQYHYNGVYVDTLYLNSAIDATLKSTFITIFGAKKVINNSMIVYYSGENPIIDYSITYSNNVILLPDPVNKPFGTLTKTGSGGNLEDKLVKVYIDGVDTLGIIIFVGCSNITQLSISDSVTSIGRGAFEKCLGLSELTIPESVTSIGINAFYDCPNITEITIPSNVKTLESGTFYNCKKLKNVTWLTDSITSLPTIPFTNVSIDNLYLNNAIGDTNISAIQTLFGATNVISVVYYSGENPVIDYSLTFSNNIALLPDPDNKPFGTLTKTGSGGNLKDKLVDVVLDGITTVEQHVFNSCSNLKSAKILNSVVELKDAVFYGCSNIETIDISNSVTSLGSFVFQGCSKLNDIILPDKLTKINEATFRSCSSLPNINIPNCVTSIGSGAFLECSSLSNIIIPDSVTDTDTHMFYDCVNLTSIKIPESVTTIKDYAFHNCSSLTSVTCLMTKNTGSTTPFSNVAVTNLYVNYKATSQFVNTLKTMFNATNVNVLLNTLYCDSSVIQNDVKYENYVKILQSSTSQTQETLKILDNGNLKDKLVEIDISGINILSDRTFKKYTNLTKVNISEDITTFGNDVFSGCSSLSYVNLLTTNTINFGSPCKGLSNCDVYVLSNNAANAATYFAGCNIITVDAVYYSGNNPTLDYTKAYTSDFILLPDPVNTPSGSLSKSGDSTAVTEANRFENRLIKAVISVNLADGSNLENGAFNKCSKLEEVVIEDSVTSIGNYTFSECSTLDNVYIPDSVTNIGVCAFYHCFGMSSIRISENISIIKESVFNSCRSLNKLTIPDNVRTIDKHAVRECGNLTNVTLPNGLQYINEAAFCADTNLNCIIPNSVKTIGNYAFYNCSKLKTTIPTSLTSIGVCAFQSCYRLKEVVIPAGVTTISDSAFKYCTDVTKLVIPNTVTAIDGQAFKACSNLTSVEIPYSVTTLGNQVFIDCSKLKTVYCYMYTITSISNACTGLNVETLYVTSSLKTQISTFFDNPTNVVEINIVYYSSFSLPDISAYNNVVLLPANTVTQGAMILSKGNTNLIGIVVKNMTSLASEAFRDCTNLRYVEFKDNLLTSVGIRAFAGCEKLTGKVDIPETVTSIGLSAFENCFEVQQINIPSAVDNLEVAFYNCYKLTDVVIPEAMENIDHHSFANCRSLTGTLNIPDNVTSLGEAAFYGCSQLDKINISKNITTIGTQVFTECSNVTEVNLLTDNTVTFSEHWCNLGSSCVVNVKGTNAANAAVYFPYCQINVVD